MTNGKFASEADLCAAFIDAVDEAWTAYPETAGFDILLVRKSDGCQIGIEAKLKLNAKVLVQAAEEEHWGHKGPDYRAVLVPIDACRSDLAGLAPFAGVTVIGMRPPLDCAFYTKFQPTLPGDDRWFREGDWRERMPKTRCDVPDYVPDVAAGASAPVQLTKWKIGAIKLAVLLQHRGHLTRDDFRRHSIDIRRWISGTNWLLPCEHGFKAGPNLPDFRAQHPRVWEEITADRDAWMPLNSEGLAA